MRKSSKPKGLIEIITLAILIFLAAIAVVFLLASRSAVSTKEYQVYNTMTRLEVDNLVERATAYLVNILKQNPTTTSFEISPPQPTEGPLSSRLDKFQIKNHIKENIYAYSYIDIIDASSKINITQDEKAFYNILLNFVKISGKEGLLKLLELKSSAKITGFVDLLTPFKKEDRKIIKDFFTVNSYINEKVVSPVGLENRVVAHRLGDNVYSLSELIPKSISYLKKAYININTAKYEVIYSLLKDIGGVYLSKEFGDIPESERDNLNPIGKLVKVVINDDEAQKVAQAIVEHRNQDSIKSWQQLEAILKNINLPEEKSALILANLNPNANLNFFYPPHPLFKRISKIDVTNYTTEITFFPTGIFELDIKVVLAKKDEHLAEESLYVVKKIFDLVEYSTQSDFAQWEFPTPASVDLYPLNNTIEFDGYLARRSLYTPLTFDNETFSISSVESLEYINSTKKVTIQNIADTKNNSLVRNIILNNVNIDATRTKEGFIVDAKNQYVITIPNIFKIPMDSIHDNKIYCSLANPFPGKKIGFTSRGYFSGWFRCLEDINNKNVVTISNMADLWSDRYSAITIRTSFSNIFIEWRGGENSKYVFKSQNLAPQNEWFQINVHWVITKDDRVSNIEIFLNGRKTEMEYFKNIKNLPVLSFFGLATYKILTFGISIPPGEYEPEFPYFFGLFDSIIISSQQPQFPQFKYDNKEAVLKVKPNVKTFIPLFVSTSIYNGSIGIYYGDLPALSLGGNIFTFTKAAVPEKHSSFSIKFQQKDTETGISEIIDDIYIATINQTIISTHPAEK